MISRWMGRDGTHIDHTPHTTHRTQGHRGGVVKSSGWLTDEADWPGWMVSKTAVPSFPCIGLQGARDQHV